MLSEIYAGMTLKCLKCGKPIKLTSETFKFNWEAEYVICPHCKATYDVQAYHRYGEVLKESE